MALEEKASKQLQVPHYLLYVIDIRIIQPDLNPPLKLKISESQLNYVSRLPAIIRIYDHQKRM